MVERADYDSTVRVTKVVDGDTVEISPSVEGLATVRLIGVDTPETHGGTQPYGPEASDFTRRNLEGKEVSLELDVEKVDPYGRLLAYVYPTGREMFNETLVEQGAAAQIAIWTAPISKPTNRLSAFLSKTRVIRPTSTATVTVWRARNYYPKV